MPDAVLWPDYIALRISKVHVWISLSKGNTNQINNMQIYSNLIVRIFELLYFTDVELAIALAWWQSQKEQFAHTQKMYKACT